MSRLIRVFEYEKLTIHSVCSEGIELGDKVIQKLWDYNDKHSNIYFDGIRNGVKFKHFVGVIQIGNITFMGEIGIGEQFFIPILSKVPWGGLVGLNK